MTKSASKKTETTRYCLLKKASAPSRMYEESWRILSSPSSKPRKRATKYPTYPNVSTATRPAVYTKLIA
jgi:hypothetical protein